MKTFSLEYINKSYWGNTYHVSVDGVRYVVRFAEDIANTVRDFTGCATISRHWETTINNPRSDRHGRKASHCKFLKAGDKRVLPIIEATLRALAAGEGKVI